MIVVKCRNCGKGLEIPEEYQGQTGKCNGCGSPIAVPFAAPTAAQPAQVIITSIPKSRVAYALLGLFFGPLGIHNFYAGRGAFGAAQLITTFLTAWTLIAIPFIWLWVIIEICVVSRDGAGKAFA